MSTDDAAIKKFEGAKLLFEQGKIRNFKELFDVVPYSIVAKKININNVRLKNKLADPTSLKLCEMKDIATLLNIDTVALCALALQENDIQKEV